MLELPLYLAVKTNSFADINSGQSISCVLCSEAEMAKLLGLLFLMGMYVQPSLHHYWSTDLLYSTNIFPDTMSGKWCQSIPSNFHTLENLALDDGGMPWHGLFPSKRTVKVSLTSM